MSKRKTTEEFVEEARKVHGSKYDYSKVEYVNKNIKVCIICPIHGEFWQAPYKHTKRHQGCPKCSRNVPLSTKEFIELANEVHDNKYDYAKTVYSRAHDKVCITCRIHGDFWQRASNHLNGQQCPKCVKRFGNQFGKKSSLENFLKHCAEIHGDTYDYSKVDYVNSETPIVIICKKHGEFIQRPYQHTRGHGCPLCAKDSRRCSTEEFIKKSIQKHNDRYDYSLVEYTNQLQKVDIICKKHGVFRQTPIAHLVGQGCPKCNESHLEKEIDEFLTNENIEHIAQYRAPWLDKLSLDFYLPKHNVAIECQGIQHFKPTVFFYMSHEKKEALFEHRLELDKQKQKKCQEHGIRLLYYSNLGIDYPYEVYEDKDCLLEEIMKENK